MTDRIENGESQDREQITFLLNPDARDRWDSYVKETPAYESRAELIRHSVEREIASEGIEESTGEQNLSEIKDGLRQLETQVDTLQKTVDAIAERTRETPAQIKELSNEVFALLPTHDEFLEYQQAVLEGGETLADAHVGPDKTNSGRVRDLAERLDANEEDVRRALVNLQEDTHRVQTVEIGDNTRFYKEV